MREPCHLSVVDVVTDITFERPAFKLARRLGRHGLIGFGESYIAGKWVLGDLVGVLTARTPALEQSIDFAPLGPRLQ